MEDEIATWAFVKSFYVESGPPCKIRGLEFDEFLSFLSEHYPRNSCGIVQEIIEWSKHATPTERAAFARGFLIVMSLKKQDQLCVRGANVFLKT